MPVVSTRLRRGPANGVIGVKGQNVLVEGGLFGFVARESRGFR